MKYVILGHKNPDVDSLISGYLLEKIMKKRGYDVSFCIPDESISAESEKICNKYGLYLGEYRVDELPQDAKYILVDHHDNSERTIPGEVVAIIDHHPTSKDMSSVKYYRNEKSCATACLLAKEYEKEASEEIKKVEARIAALGENEKEAAQKVVQDLKDDLAHDIKLACVATFVDCVSFHSTKAVKTDVSWANDMVTKYELDYDEIYVDGLCLTELTNVEEIAFNGFKAAKYGDFHLHSSYIQIADLEKSKDVIDGIIEVLRQYREDNGIDLFVFSVYDMTNFRTRVYKISEEVEIKEYGLYASRGNTIIPDILKERENKGLKK